MMIKSVDVHEGDTIWARDRKAVLGDLRTLDQRLAAMEAINGPGAWQNCLNCLSEIFFWGVGEVTSDDGDDTYTLKPKYISNTGVTESDAMTTGDMDTADGIKPSITATAVGTGEVSVEDEFLVFGGFDAGAGDGEPIVRYFFESRGGAGIAWHACAGPTTIHDGGAHFNTMYRTGADVIDGQERYLYRFPDDHRPLDFAAVLGFQSAQSVNTKIYTEIPVDTWPNFTINFTFRMLAFLITEDFNPATVTWATQPAISQITARAWTVGAETRVWGYLPHISWLKGTRGIDINAFKEGGLEIAGTDAYGIELIGDFTDFPGTGQPYYGDLGIGGPPLLSIIVAA